MPLDQDFILRLTKLIEEYVTNSSLEKASSEQSYVWGSDDQKNFSHGWFVGFLEGMCVVHFINTFNRKPNEEEESEMVVLVRKHCYKIKEMVDRKFELTIIQ
jgi:hypothetical protein